MLVGSKMVPKSREEFMLEPKKLMKNPLYSAFEDNIFLNGTESIDSDTDFDAEENEQDDEVLFFSFEVIIIDLVHAAKLA